MIRPNAPTSACVTIVFFLSFLVLFLRGSEEALGNLIEAVGNRKQNHLRQEGGSGKGTSGKHDIHNNNHNNEDGEATERSLIIGGSDAVNYPRSISFLSDRIDDLSCGGSLISPTIVLAAGHCEISLISDAVFLRYEHPTERLESTGLGIHSENEIRIPVRKEILHPEYDRKTLRNDVMLIVLEESPNAVESEDEIDSRFEGEGLRVPYMRLHNPHTDPSIDALLQDVEARQGKSVWDPKSKTPKTTNLQFKALGWGHTKDGEEGKPSDTLQEVTVNYVRNDDCSDANEGDLISYEDRITKDMMCTWHSNRDTCHGDSGGPIILENPNYKKNAAEADQFVQIGIVSWGEDCADRVFPGVASRVSEAFDWIQRRVCSIDGTDAPNYFNCTDEHTYSPVPSMSPTTWEEKLEAHLQSDALSLLQDQHGKSLTAPSTTTTIAVEIELDIFAAETGWSLKVAETDHPVEQVAFSTYKYENRIYHEYQLPVGHEYEFEIRDEFGDGITKKGGYRVYVVDPRLPGGVGTILAEGDGDFTYARTHSFVVPVPPPAPEPVSLEAASVAATTATKTATIDSFGKRKNRIKNLRFPV